MSWTRSPLILVHWEGQGKYGDSKFADRACQLQQKCKGHAPIKKRNKVRVG